MRYRTIETRLSALERHTQPPAILIQPVDAHGQPVGPAVAIPAGVPDYRRAVAPLMPVDEGDAHYAV